MKQAAYIMAGVLIGFVLAGALFIVVRLPGGKPVALEPAPTKAPLEVQVIGGVVRPGVYELPEGSRVKDAIDAAGGLLAETDAGGLNLAAKVEDGQQLQIGSGTGSSSVAGGTGTGSGSGPRPGSTGAPPFTLLTTPTPAAAANLMNINTATVPELDTLPGISPTVAQNIVTYRDANGPYSQIEDILNVPGVGPATFDSIKNRITVTAQP